MVEDRSALKLPLILEHPANVSVESAMRPYGIVGIVVILEQFLNILSIFISPLEGYVKVGGVTRAVHPSNILENTVIPLG